MNGKGRGTAGPLRPAPEWPAGRVVVFEHTSDLLDDNALGDPAHRSHPVYLPAEYDASPDRHFPVLWCLAAYTNSGPGQVAWRNHGETLPQRLDRLIGRGEMPPVIAVFPDCYTSLGGNQYVNTPAMGPYADYLVDELVPAVDGAFRTIPEPAGRAVFGKSSGGFGALHLSMARPGRFAAAASHAGDCGFDRAYAGDFPVVCDTLAASDGDIEGFARGFWRKQRPRGSDFHTMMVLCLAASYSPDPEQPLGLRLPFNLRTCRLETETWARWLAFDPVVSAPEHAAELNALAGLWIDVGHQDQYAIHFGTRQLHDLLDESGIDHLFEEFQGTHSGIDWRFDHSLPWLAGRLKHD